MLKFILRPFDILFFGSGKPFNLSVQEASSFFPPLPTSLAGAICSKIANKKKIDTSRIIKNLYGPFLEKNNQILFPKPLDILGEKKKGDGEISGVKLLEANNFKLINPEYTDLSDFLKELLWEKKRDREFEIFDAFITLDGLKRWFKNQEVERNDLVFKQDIFVFEHRIGISMDYSRNTTKEEDALYRVDFIRLKENVKMVILVEFDYDDNELYELFNDEIKVLKLGGEMKSVYYECEKVEDIYKFFSFNKPDIENGDKIKILYLTPGTKEKDESYEIISGSVKMTDLGMYTNYGIVKRKGIKEGSVIYAKVKDKDKLEKNIWLKPKTNEFIGCDLRIYTKL